MSTLTQVPTTTTPTPARRRLGVRAAALLVAEREILVKLRDRAFIISTLVTLGLLVAAFAAPAFISAAQGDTRIATVGPVASSVADSLRAGDDELDVVAADDGAAAEALVREGEVDVALVDTGDGTGAGVEIVADTSVPDGIAQSVDAAVAARAVSETLTGLGADEATIATTLAPPQVPQRFLDPDAERALESTILQVAFAAIFFFTALTFGLTISQSITEEKQQRVVELLVAAVPVRAMLIGKVLGNVVLALGQIVLIIAAGLIAASATGQGQFVPLLAGSAGWFIAFFLAGFLMISCLWAAAGAMASSYEDMATTTLPIQMLVTLPFVAAVSIRDGVAQTVLSFLPVTSPIVMPQRLVAGEAPLWQAVVSLVLIVLTAAALVVVAERLYRGSLMRTRGRVGLAEAWRGARD